MSAQTFILRPDVFERADIVNQVVPMLAVILGPQVGNRRLRWPSHRTSRMWDGPLIEYEGRAYAVQTQPRQWRYPGPRWLV